MKRSLLIFITLFVATSCARLDYHGIDPQTYNEVIYPKKATVKHSSIFHSFYFVEASPKFDANTIESMDHFLAHSYPDAVERLLLTFSSKDPDRELYLTRLLRARGYKKSSMEYAVDETMHQDEVIILMDYSYAEVPRCPDWRKDPSINYSNTNYSNFGCTHSTNYARQIANPHDLVESSATRIPTDANRNALAIGTYRSGVTPELTAGAAEE